MTLDFLFRKNNCFNQLQELERRTDEAVPILKKNLLARCKSIQEKPVWSKDDYVSYACPCQNIHHLATQLVQAAHSMKVGILPYDGGLFEQPAILMELVSMTQSFLIEQEQKEMKEAHSKNQKKR